MADGTLEEVFFRATIVESEDGLEVERDLRGGSDAE